MRFHRTKEFASLYKKLPADIRKRANNQLRLLLENPRHPSLRLHKIRSYTNLWEISVTMHYRITFEIEGDEYVLRRIGPHDTLKRP